MLSCVTRSVVAATITLVAGTAALNAQRFVLADAVVLAAGAEVARIRAHLAAVEAELLAADVSRLTGSQQQARARHIAVLREYREAGVFPHNHVAPGRRVPVFMDEHGTHCAVGYLLARDGRSDIVQHVRSTRNLATVPELANEPALITWLGEAGLAVEEAARIQPWYGEWPPQQEPAPRSSHAYTVASLVGVGTGGGMIAWNLLVDTDSPSRRRAGLLGVGVGVADMTLAAYGAGLDRRADREIDSAHIVMNLGVGLASSVLGLQTLLESPRPEATITTDAALRQRVQWRVTPWSAGEGGGAGMRLNLRF